MLKIALVLIPNVFLMSVCNITFANHTSQGCISLLLRLITADNPPHPTSKSEWACFCIKGFGGKKGREDGFGPQVRNLNFFGLKGQLQLQWVFSVFKHLVRLPSHIKNFDTHLCNSAPSVFKPYFSPLPSLWSLTLLITPRGKRAPRGVRIWENKIQIQG